MTRTVHARALPVRACEVRAALDTMLAAAQRRPYEVRANGLACVVRHVREERLNPVGWARWTFVGRRRHIHEVTRVFDELESMLGLSELRATRPHRPDLASARRSHTRARTTFRAVRTDRKV